MKKYFEEISGLEAGKECGSCSMYCKDELGILLKNIGDKLTGTCGD